MEKEEKKIKRHLSYIKYKEKYKKTRKLYYIKNKEEIHKRYIRNKEQLSIKHKIYYQNNKEKLNQYRNEYGWKHEGRKPRNEIGFDKGSDGYKNHVANIRFKKRYGITLDEYNLMFTKQNGVCAICLKPEIIVQHKKIMKLSVDHCHDSNKVRGLLCGNCNRGLGHFKDNITLLEKSIEYLKQSRVSR